MIHGTINAEPGTRNAETKGTTDFMKFQTNLQIAKTPNRQMILRGALMELSNFRMVDVNAEVSSPFASLGYKPDAWKMYVEFDICHSVPTKIGPVEAMNYVGYFPSTLAVSHASLMHQQFNLGHKLKAYSPKRTGAAVEGERGDVARDRIIGCIVATSFPQRAPNEGWISPANPKGAPAHIRALAVVFKLAEGVAQIMGAHLTSRVKQSVSIECITNLGNIGIMKPSTLEVFPLLDPPDDVLGAMSPPAADYLLPHVGKLNGEQLVVIYGMNGAPVSFRGVGMTPTPAERVAKIVSVAAEECELRAIAAAEVGGELVGQTVTFKSGRSGKVEKVHTEGEVRLRGSAWSMKATVEEPVLEIRLSREHGARSTEWVLRKASEAMA